MNIQIDLGGLAVYDINPLSATDKEPDNEILLRVKKNYSHLISGLNQILSKQ